MARLRTLTLLFATLMALTTGCAGAASSPSQVTVTLPEPTGKHPVGVVDLHLNDPGRTGLDGTLGRDVMVSLWYPARDEGDVPPATWLPAPTASYLAAQLHTTAQVPADRWRLAPLTARYGVAAARLSSHQLVLLSPGYGMVRGLYTGLAQDLASRGHVVAVIDHPGDAGLVTLPDGRRQRQVPLDQNNKAAVQANIAARADDLRFVLDQLDQLHTGARSSDTDEQPLPINLAPNLHTAQAVGIGHSFGGPTVMTAMTADRRIATGVNLDGSLYSPVTAGIPQPVLAVASDGHLPGKDPSWQRWCTGTHPPADAVMLPGAAHLSFTDLTAILPALRAADLITSAATINTIGPMDPAASRKDQTSIITAWLTRPGQLGPAHPTAPIEPLPACRP